MKTRMSSWLTGLALVVAGSGGLAEETAVTPSGDALGLPAVRLITADPSDAAITRSFFGKVAARETVDLSFEVGGHLTVFPVTEGATVREGDLLAQLDLDAFERNVELAQIGLTQASRDLARAETLSASNVASQVRAEDAMTQRDRADVALREARAAMEDATLRAPFEGIVAARVATNYSNIDPGVPVLRLHDMSEVRVEIEVPERVFVQARDPSRIAFTANLPGGGEVPVTLAEYEAQTGAVGQSFRVALRLPEVAAANLIPGVTMTVTARLPGMEADIALPTGAILANTERGFEVMVYTPETDTTGTVHRREVALHAPGGLGFSVDGLEPGERIVAAGGHLLRDGQSVRIYDGLVVEEAQ